MKIKDMFDVCPLCKGSGETLHHLENTYDKMEVIECTHCFFGVVIKDEWYDKIADKLGVEYEY